MIERGYKREENAYFPPIDFKYTKLQKKAENF